MSKLEEGKNILNELKVPLKQQSDLCGYVILAMADIKRNDKWAKATNKYNYLKSHQNLIDLYSLKKVVRKMPVKINGDDFTFSLGKINYRN